MNNAVIEKIRKLLRMKHGGTEAEIETALSLAQRLAAKNGIDINSIKEDQEDAINISNLPTTSRIQMECKYACLIVQQFFYVYVVIGGWRGISRKHISFVGTSLDIEIAKYVYDFLVGHFRRKWNKRENKRLKNRNAFMQGIYMGIRYKLEQERNALHQEYGLMCTGKQNKLDDYFNSKFGKLKTAKIENERPAAAMEAGYKIGKETNIRKAVNTSNKVKCVSNE